MLEHFIGLSHAIIAHLMSNDFQASLLTSIIIEYLQKNHRDRNFLG